MMKSRSPRETGRFGRHGLVVLAALAGLIFSGLGISSGPQARQRVPQLVASQPAVPLASNQAASPTPAQQQAAPSAAEPAKGRLLSLRLLPQDVSLRGAGASHRFLALGKYADGLERDVTSQSRFSLSDPRLARVDQSGQVVALADGEMVLTAELAGRSARTNLRIEGSKEQQPFSFARDISAIFTKRGCNSSSCHGSVKGRGGLKLSMDASDPKEDYRWIVQGGIFAVLTVQPAGPTPPRVDLKEPEKSLLLLKPTFGVPHGGGLRFSRDSSDYATILNWVRKGAPYGEDDAQARIERVVVYPREVFLDPQGKQQLLVAAYLANGRQRDLTEQVRYESNNEGVAEVSEEGVVKARGSGETSVIIHAPGQQPLSAWIGVIAKPVQNYPVIAPRNFIDDYTFARLRKLNIVPSELSSDAEFLRRVCLDLTGTLPPPQRVREFLASKDPRKRDKLIETLLNSPEYVDYWTWRFADLFRVVYENGLPIYPKTYWGWIRASIAENKPYDQIARERIAAEGLNGPSRHYYNGSDLRRPQDIMAEQVRVFLGRRLDCAQCHNHPYETWTQNQFWGLTGFFGRLSQLGEIGGIFPPVVIDDPAGHGDNGGGAKVIQPRTKEEVYPKFLDGKPLPENEQADPRQALAEWMTSPSNPYFATAAVDRMWGCFFSRGIVDPVDDFRSTNPPTHPELLETLAKDFKEHKYDLKHLIRLIVQSRTYQLSSTRNATNQDDATDYSHALPRPLDAEVLLDAISQVTGVDEVFHGTGEELGGGRAPSGTRAIDLISPDMFPSRFLEIYGRPDRQMVPQRKVEANLAQALDVLAGSTYNGKLGKEGSRIDRLLKSSASDRLIIEELYLAALSRFPTAEEEAALEGLIRRQPSRQGAVEDLTWGIISSREFAYNH